MTMSAKELKSRKALFPLKRERRGKNRKEI